MKKAIAKDVTVSVNYEDNITYYDDKGNPHTYTTGDTATKVGGPFENEQAFPYTTIHTVITSTNTLEIKLTEANVWIVEYKQEFTSQAPPKDEKSQDNPQKDQPYTVTAPTADHTAIGDALGESYRASVEASYSAAHTRASASLTGMNTEYYTAVVGRNIHVYTKTEGLIYVSSPATVREKVELTGDENNFVKIYTSPKHATTASNIHSAPDWLYLLLSQNSSTANMVDVTKYLLYKATDYDYGVQSYDFSVYKPENFKKLYDKFSNLDGVPGKVYNFLLSKGVSPAGAAAVLGNIQEASNFEANTTSSNGGNGLCLWKNDRFKNLQSWAKSNHKAWTGVTTQLEFMWSELESKYPSVKNKITGATEENLEYVTWYWGRFYEGFFVGTNFEKTKSNTAQRYMYAQQWLEKVK